MNEQRETEVSRWRAAWRLLVALVGTAVIVIDIVAFAGWGSEATLSRVVLSGSINHPSVPLAVGFVMGHLFWPQRPKE